MGEKVVVAMSGGVDSSVAALLLKELGYEVVGVTMKLYGLDAGQQPSYHRGCCTVDDVEDARRVCQRLGMRHYVLNLEREFSTEVIDYFCNEYRLGRTPHPCIACNDKIKFSFLTRRASLLGARYVATGHYARIEDTGEGYVLRKGVDAARDQSYVLFGMGQRELGRTLFPIGVYSKPEIRALASEAGFPNAEKPDSQDICFIPNRDYRAFIAGRIGTSGGEIVNRQGEVLGHHDGIEGYTVGQRRRLGIAAGEPRYVLRLEAETGRVVVGTEAELYTSALRLGRVNYVSGRTPTGPFQVQVKIRYRFKESEAELRPDGENAYLVFQEPQRAVTPGQAAVFYVGDILLGGGIIESSWVDNGAIGDRGTE